jgi:hypothetical protein
MLDISAETFETSGLKGRPGSVASGGAGECAGTGEWATPGRARRTVRRRQARWTNSIPHPLAPRGKVREFKRKEPGLSAGLSRVLPIVR